jgi:hypothetical protein
MQCFYSDPTIFAHNDPNRPRICAYSNPSLIKYTEIPLTPNVKSLRYAGRSHLIISTLDSAILSLTKPTIMPALPLYPLIRPRNDSSTSDTSLALDNLKVSIIASIALSIIIIVVFALWIQLQCLPWYRRSQAAKVARRKAIADHKAWYRSTKPIVRRPWTPHLVDVYSRTAHIQAQADHGAHVADSSHSDGLGDNNVLQTPSERVVSGSADLHDKDVEPFPAFDPEFRPSMESSNDLGLHWLRDSYQSHETACTVASIGVAVPVKLPAAASPSEIYHGRRIQREEDQASPFVVGDDEDNENGT